MRRLEKLSIREIGIWLGLLCIAASVWGQQYPARLYRKADKAMARHDLSRAVDKYERLAARGSADAMAKLGHIFYRQKTYDEAEKWTRKALQLPNCPASAYQLRSRLWLSAGALDSAITWQLHYLSRNPADQPARDQLGFMMAMRDRTPDSTAAVVSRLNMHTSHAESGIALFRNGLLFGAEYPNAVLGVTHWGSTSGTHLMNLYYTEETDSARWSRPSVLRDGWNTRFHEGTPAFGTDDLWLFFTRSGNTRKHRATRKLMSAMYDGEQWLRPQWLATPGLDGNVSYPCIAPDGETIYFASDAPGGYGGLDIYRGKLGQNEILDIELLGESINSPGNEFYPHIRPDGQLWFASDGWPGYGGTDLFYGYPDSAESMPPRNAGLPLNSALDDLSIVFRASGDTAYFSSNRDSRSRDFDLYQYTLTAPEFEDCQPQVETPLCYVLTEETSFEHEQKKLYYRWDLDDGQTRAGNQISYCFSEYRMYDVRLEVVDSLTGEPILLEASYTIDLRRPEQAYVQTTGDLTPGRPIGLDARDSNLPDLVQDGWYWDFGDGTTGTGQSTEHVYPQAGTYAVRLGVTGRNRLTGEPEQHCVLHTLVIGDSSLPEVATATDENSTDASDATPADSDIVFERSGGDSTEYKVQLGTSLSPVQTDPAHFRDLDGVEAVRDDSVYRYVYGEFPALDSAIKGLRAVRDSGYYKAVVLTYKNDSLVDGQPYEDHWLPARGFDFRTVAGHVRPPQDSLLPGGSKVIWQDMATGEVVLESAITQASGDYVAVLPNNMRYSYFTEVSGYFPLSYHMDLNDQTGDIVMKDSIVLVSVAELIASGRPVRLNNVFFDFDKDDLKPASHQELYRVLKFLNENPDLTIEIAGHTDDRGTDAYNVELSSRRASAVARFLVLAGCLPERVSAQGYGEYSPMVSNATAGGRALNRRVEFRVFRDAPTTKIP